MPSGHGRDSSFDIEIRRCLGKEIDNEERMI